MEKNIYNVHVIIKDITTSLETRYDSSTHAHTVAWWLLERLTEQSKLELITLMSIKLSEQDIRQINSWVTQHLDDDYPLHYILGSVPFGPLTLSVEPPTLIPRPETEEWLATLIETLEPVKNEKLTILDMCTGSGCIALWLAKAFPNATIYAVDIVDSALTLAKKNAQQNNISNIVFLKSDLFTLLAQDIKFDCIISNPPYIAPEEWNDLSPTIRKWEDRGALIAGNQGFEIITQLIAQAPYYLNQQSVLRKHELASLVMEIGYNQSKEVQKLFVTAGFTQARILNDSAGIGRVVIG
ncbi:MAG: release factor glutamine methyltransferase [Alteromonas naphthalenivorans]|jgi:release factor glutamine methyltransferase